MSLVSTLYKGILIRFPGQNLQDFLLVLELSMLLFYQSLFARYADQFMQDF